MTKWRCRDKNIFTVDFPLRTFFINCQVEKSLTTASQHIHPLLPEDNVWKANWPLPLFVLTLCRLPDLTDDASSWALQHHLRWCPASRSWLSTSSSWQPLTSELRPASALPFPLSHPVVFTSRVRRRNTMADKSEIATDCELPTHVCTCRPTSVFVELPPP